MLDRRRTSLATLLTASCVLAGSLVVAGPRLSMERPQPHRYNPRSLDGPLVSLTSPVDGRAWSAWSYRDGAEYDIAVSFRDPGGFWSEPHFVGRDDGIDQVQPALAMDELGNLYLAYAEVGTGQVRLTALPAGETAWSDPVSVTLDGERGSMPALSVIGDRLAVAFRSGRMILIRDLPLLEPPPLVPSGIHDSPDPYGNKDDRTNPGAGGG